MPVRQIVAVMSVRQVVVRQVVVVTLAAAFVAALVAGSGDPARAHHSSIRGTVTDATTGAPIPGVCITVGPPIRCEKLTDANGFFFIDLAADGALDGLKWEVHFLKNPDYQMAASGPFVVDGPVTFNQTLWPSTRPAPCPPAAPGVPTQSVFLPNVTKTFGGPDGWQTPFIVQNTGSVPTTLEITFFRFLNGQCITRRTVRDLQPGTSFADVPNNDHDLPGDTQFAVVVRSFGAPVVAVVNEHAGSGARAEALAYVGAPRGANSVFLPNITRRFFGYVTPFIIQNLGNVTTTATARFVSFDGSAPTVSVTRTIDAGKSRFVDPNSDDPAVGAPGLRDGKQYAVTVTAPDPISIVVNTHNDAPGVAAPVAYSTNGIVGGARELFGAYAAKNAAGVGRVTTIVVQNLGTTDVTPNLVFLPLGITGAPQLFVSPNPVPPGGSWAFDPRFTLGTTEPCSTPSSSCLGDGEYSFFARAGQDSPIAAQVNVISTATAMGYTAAAQSAAKFFLPNVTRTLCACSSRSRNVGWTTPILLQGVTASAANLRWFRFSDGMLVHTQRVELPSHSAVRIDPRDIRELADDTQYAVVVEGVGGSVNAIVLEFAPGGDNAMTYEGFAEAGATPEPGPTAAPTPEPTRAPVPTPTPGPTPTLPPIPSPGSGQSR